MGRKKTPEAAAGHDTLVLRTETLLAGMAHGRADRTSRRAEIPPPEEAAGGFVRPKKLAKVESWSKKSKFGKFSEWVCL